MILTHRLRATTPLLEDINLSGAANEMTSAIADSKGWTYPYGVNQWGTTFLVLEKTLNLASLYDRLIKEDIWLRPGVSYTLRAYTTNSTGSGTEYIGLVVRDSGGDHDSSTTEVTATDGWKTLVFTPDEALNDIEINHTASTNVTSTITITEIELYET